MIDPALATALACSDVAIGVIFNTNGTSIGADRYDVSIVSQDANVVGAATTGLLLADNAIALDEFTNTSNTTGDIVYRVTPHSSVADGDCIGDPFDITVTIAAEPAGFDDIIPVQCSNTIQYNFQTQNVNNIGSGGNGVLSLFSYTVSSNNPGVTAEPDRITANRSVSPINFTYINKTGSDAVITYTVTPYALAGSNCEGDPFIVEFTIESDPVGFDEPVPIEICSDFDGTSPLIYDLQGNINNLGSGGNGVTSEFTYTVSGSLVLDPNRTIRSSDGIDFNYINQTSSTKTITYVVTPYADTPNGCAGDPFTLRFDILPEPVGLDQSEIVCGGVASPVNYTIQNAITNGISSVFTYDVTSSNEAVVPTPNSLNRTTASNLDIADTYTNTSSNSVTVTYTVTPFDDVTGCQGQDFDLDFVIIPGPAGVADAEDICSGEQINYDIFADNINNGGNGVAGTYKYTVSAVDPGGDLSPVASSLNRAVATTQPITDTFVNSGSSVITVTYEITPVNTLGLGCFGANFSVTFDVYPAPIGTDDLDEVLCSREATSYDLQGNINANNGLASEFSYTVTSSDPGAVPPLSGQAFAAGPISIPVDSYINTTSSAVFITYTVTPRRIGVAPVNCIGDPFNVRFRIDPEPVVDPSLAGPFPICSDDVTGINLSTAGSSVVATYYTISVNPNGLIQSAGTNSSGLNKTAVEIADDAWTNTSNAAVPVFYTVTPFSSLDCEGQPFIIEVSINPEPVFDASISPAPVCSDDPLNVQLGVAPTSVAATSYDVISVTPDVGLTPVVTTTGNGLTLNAIINDSFINTTGSPKDVRYVVRPANGNCKGDNFILIITIFSAPNLDQLDATVCSDELSGIILSASVGATAAEYRIVSVVPEAGLTIVSQTPDNTQTPDPSIIATDQYINTTNASLDVVYTIIPIEGFNSCEGPAETVTLTVEPEPTLVIPPNENICNEAITSILLSSITVPKSGNPQDVTFDVQATPIGSVTGAPFVRQNLSNGFVIADNLRNLGNTVAEVQYTITPKILGGCSGAPTIVSVFVEPEPVGSFTDTFVTICEGEALDPLNVLATSVSPSGAGTIEFSLVAAFASDPAVTGFTQVGDIGPLTVGDALTDVINITDGVGITSTQTVTYQFTPSIVGSNAGTCAGTDNSVQLIVNVLPRPVVTPSVTTATICSGQSIEINLVTDIDNSFARWTASPNANVDGEFDGQGNTLFVSLINRSTTPQTVTYTVEPFLLFDSNCTGPTEIITITVDPNPDVTVDQATITVCSGEPVNIELNGSVPGSIFNWSADLPDGSTITGSGTNGDLIPNSIINTSGVPQFVRFDIDSEFGINSCPGNPPGIVFVTVNPIVEGQIVTEDEILCTGNSKAIQFEFMGAPPFSMTYEVTQGGTTTTVTENNLPSNYVILATETVQYTLLNVRDNNGCEPVGFIQDNVSLTFEEAIANMEVRGADALNTFAFTGDNSTVNLDFNTGTGTVEFRFNDFNPDNLYTLQIGDETFNVTASTFQYTFTEPSTFGTLGLFIELQVRTPNDDVNSCNDVDSFFIEVLPAQPTVVGVADILEGCPPLTVNFESFREDLSLSKNVIVEDLVWTIDGNTLNTPNPTFTFTQRGVYNIQVKGDNGHGDEEIAELVITVFDKPTAIFEITQTVVYIPDDGFRPTNRSQRASEYEWDFGDFSFGPENQFRSPEHFYEEEGEYIVTLNVKNEFGCVDSAIDTVIVEEGGFTKTPNAFTPSLNGPSGGAEFDPSVPGSGDSANDIFLPITTGVEDFKMYIYDRWGNLIFFSDNKRVGWDGYSSKGQILPPGVYVYKLDLILSSGQRTTRVGDVTLIR